MDKQINKTVWLGKAQWKDSGKIVQAECWVNGVHTLLSTFVSVFKIPEKVSNE